ncbi:MAG: hypothetical protein ACOY9J_11915 [Pseudomonadota bacterium]
MSKNAKKSAKKPALKRSLLSHAVAVAAVAVGGFGQQAFAVDLCTTPSNTISALSPADECLLDTSGESLAVTLAGSLGQGVDATFANVTISNLGLIADDYTAIEFDSVGLDGSLSNTGTVEVDSGNNWAMGVYVRNNASIGGTLNNGGDVNAVAVNAGSNAYAYGIYVDGESTSTPWVDLDTATNATHFTSDYSYIGLESTGTLINSGTVSASAQVNSSWAYATGVDINGAVLGDITNSGTISAAAGAWYGAYAYGAELGGGWIGTGDQTGSSSTVGESSLTAYAYTGDEAYVGLGTTASLVNSGTISAAADVSYAYASATALRIEGVVQGSLDNSGTISAEATNTNYYNAAARALVLEGGDVNTWSGSGSSGVDAIGADTSTDSATTWASTWAYLGLDSAAALTNSGSIEAMAYSYGYYGSSAEALSIDGAVLGDISNSLGGNILAVAEADYDSGAYASAVYVGGDWVGNSSGAWNQSTDSSTSPALDTYASTSGSQTASVWSYTGLGTGAALTNAGTIQALADAGYSYAYATGAAIDGAVLGSIDNSGSIAASATASNNYVYADAVAVYGGDVGSESGSDVYTYSSSTAVVSPTETRYEWSTATGSNYASENSYIGLGSAAALTNTGTISAAAHAGYYARANALEINGAVLGTLSNSGSIAASAQADGYNASALGVGVWGGDITSYNENWSRSADGMVTMVTSVPVNSTATTTASASAWASDSAWSYTGIGSGASLTNSGTITVSADANYSSTATAYATGVSISGAVLGTLSNSGTVTVSAEAGGDYAYADGLALYGGEIGSQSYDDNWNWNGMSSTTVTVSATTTETVTAWASTSATNTAYASEDSYIGLGSAAALTNSGTISVSADAGNYYANAEGLTVDGTVLGSINNSGSITVSAEAYDSPNALGLALWGDYITSYSETQSDVESDAGTVTTTTDTATLDVTTLSTWSGNRATTSAFASSWADTALGSAATLTNSGTISATARADQYWAYATAVDIGGSAVLGQINNLGTISATAINDNYQGAYALGMELGGGWVGSDDYSYNRSDSYNGMSSSSPVALSSASTTNSASAWSYVSNDGYIGLGSSASLTNSGTISAAATVFGGGSGSSATATALYINGAVQGAIDNSGTISASASVDANGSGYYAYALGLYLNGGSGFESESYAGTWSGATTVNTSNTDLLTDITTTAWAYNSASASAWASTDSDEVALDLGASLTNSGTISATADADYYASAEALYIDGTVLGSIVNSGNITAAAETGSYDAYANALHLRSDDVDAWSGSDTYSYSATASSTSGPLSYTSNYAWNSASAGTWASDYAEIALGSAAALTNSGLISATAVAGYSSANATALEIEGAVLGTVANTGTISASATSNYYYADALAVYLDGDWVSSYSGSWDYTDSGTSTTVGVITETMTNSAWATTYVTDEAYVALGAGAMLTNSGTIAATATAGNLATTSGSSVSATAVRMYGAVLGAISNSGTISATALAGYEDARAIGVTLDGGSVDHYSGDSTGTWSESSTSVSQSTSATNWMTDESYVSLGTTGSFANTGSISAQATAGAYDASASALEIDGALLGTLTNSGSISAKAVAGDYYAYASGVSLYGGSLYTENGTRTNGINAYTYTYADVSLGGSLINDGVISAVAQAGYSSAYADGVALYGAIRGSLTNNGEITATATAGYDDAYATAVTLGSGWVSSGNQDTSEGDYFSLESGGLFSNTGTINAFAEAGDDYAGATALYSWGQMAGNITNSGTMRASANANYDAWAGGLIVSDDVSGTITNSNAIAASADAEYYADAVALAVWGNVSGSIVNSDSLGAYAGARYYGASAQGVYVDHLSGTISNSGTVDVAADAGTGWASATGFRVDGGMSGTGSLTNTGYVGVLAESNESSVSAYGVRVMGAMHDTAMVSNASGALISVQANGTGSETAYGIDLGMMFDNAQLVNAGDISVMSQSNDTSGSDAVVYGVHTDGLYDAAQLVNSGSIRVEQSAFGDALVVGLATGSIHNSAGALNSGTVSVSAAGQVGQVSATGIAFGSAYAGATMTNSGTIMVQADGSSMFGGLFGDTLAANVQAVGISLDSQMVDSTLANTGTIKVVSNSSSGATTAAFDELFGSTFDFGGDASVYGIKAGLVDGASTISNSGSIMAEATGSDNAAYGIYVRALTNGAMVVNASTIDVDAGAAGNAYGIYVAGGTSGLVSNSGTISDGVFLRGNVGLNNAGSIINRASFVGGNYAQGVGGSLSFPVQDVADYGRIAVVGTADFTASNSVVVLLNASDELESGDVLADVVSAGTLTASAFDVSDNTLFWNFTPVIDGNTLDLTADYRGAAGVLAGTGFNLSASLAEVIDGIIDEGADGQYADLAAALHAASDDAAAAALLSGFLPTLNGDVVDATRVASGGVSNSIDSRIAESRGAASGDAVNNGGVWLKTYFGMAEQDKVGNVNGYDVDSNGVVIGVDGDVSDAWRVGLAVGLAKADVDAPLAKVDIASNLFTLYGSYTLNDRTALDLTLGFGSHDYDGVRNAGTYGTASSTFDGDQLSFGANLSRTIKQGDKKVFIPSVSFQYLEVNVGGYSETGAGIMNNTVASIDETSVSVLAKGTWEWTMANTGVFAAHLGLGFDSTDDAGAQVTLAGNGPTYNVKGAEAEDVLLAAGLGYRYVTSKDLEIVVGYDLEAREDFQAGVAAIKFKMPF